MDFARRIVSGNKARYTSNELDLDLDLVYLTDRIVLMGYPATGLASTYRNQRKDVLKLLEHQSSDYMILNLCPRYEAKYDASEFKGKVRRCPWPDHHPPPLSMFPIILNRIQPFMNARDDNMLFIHCKAGKGRSGTCAISYLLAQPGLPAAPSVPGTGSEPSVKAIDARPVPPKDDANLTLQQKLDHLFEFHTSRRMAPGTKSKGVMRYKDSYATALRERELRLAERGSDKFDDDQWEDEAQDLIVRVADFKELSETGTAPTSQTPSGATTPYTASSTPVTAVAPTLDQELAEADVRGEPHVLSCHAIYRPPSRCNVVAHTKDEAKAQAQNMTGLLLDADREVEFKLLLGKSGSKHGALPAMAALGIIWIVPAFERAKNSVTSNHTVRIEACEIDFLKPQANIKAVELDFEWSAE
ncbi:Telomerase protein component 1 [Microbotryomycetes sp. JL221]|nr:Telomerase protein component 1 [Microbotryomycetes sp. JL221]